MRQYYVLHEPEVSTLSAHIWMRFYNPGCVNDALRPKLVMQIRQVITMFSSQSRVHRFDLTTGYLSICSLSKSQRA